MSERAAGARRLRILVVGLRYPPYVAGGYELLTRDTVEGLRARGHRVDVLTGRGERLAGEPGVHSVFAPSLDGEEDLFQRSFRASNFGRARLHLWRTANWRAARRVIARVEPDLVLYFNLSLLSLAPLAAARTAGVPTLGLVCDPWPLNHWLRFWRERGGKPARRRLLERLWRVLRDTVRLEPFLVPSETLRAEFVADGLGPAGIARLPLAMSPEMEELAQGAYARPRTGGEPLRVLAASYLWEGKGVHVLLEGAAEAVRAGANLELEIAGSGQEAYVTRLRERAATAPLAGRVRFLGNLTRRELSDAMKANHVLAFPSLWGEPYALAPLEAMGHGLALVGSDAGGTPEQVVHGRTGWIAPAGDAFAWGQALVALAGDDGMRIGLAESGRARMHERHTQRAFLDGLEVHVARAAGPAPRRPRTAGDEP